MATPGPVNRSQLEANYQNPGDVYDDTKTEGAFNVLADQIDANAVVFNPNGAASVPSALIPGLAGLNVHEQLKSLESKIQQLQDGVVPSGSITSAMIQDLAVTYAKLSPELQATITAANQWKVEDGLPKYFNGTEWLDVGVNKILIPSTTEKIVDTTERTSVSPDAINNVNYTLVHKWTPSNDGEVKFSADMKLSAVNATAVPELIMISNAVGSYATATQPLSLPRTLPPPPASAVTDTFFWDINTPLGTSIGDQLSAVFKNNGGLVSTVFTGAVTDTFYVTREISLKVFQGRTIYFLLKATANSATPYQRTMSIRNIKIKYSEMILV